MFLDQHSPILPDNQDRTLTHICQFLYIFSQSPVSFKMNKFMKNRNRVSSIGRCNIIDNLIEKDNTSAPSPKI